MRRTWCRDTTPLRSVLPDWNVSSSSLKTTNDFRGRKPPAPSAPRRHSDLDAEDLVPGHYTLEVSSPGLERKLFKPKDYQRFQGQKATVVLRDPVEGRRTWEGILAGYADGMVSLETEPGKTRQFLFEQVRTANLKFEW